MALLTNIEIEEFQLNINQAYIKLSRFVWNGEYCASASFDVWASIEAKEAGKLPIKRLEYQIDIPLQDTGNPMTATYNQVRSLVYGWAKNTIFEDASDI